MPIADLDRLLDPGYVGAIRDRPIADVRAMRSECQRVESKISYLRRLVQGHLDIVSSEMHNRSGGGSPADSAALVAALPRILADRLRAPGLGRLPSNLTPPDDDELTSELDQVVRPDVLVSLSSLSDVELAELAERLTRLEGQVSAQRKALFGVIDALSGELARRYGDGEADPASLLS